MTLERAEAYMNVAFADGREKTILLGMKYLDDRNGALYMQDHEGWLKPSGKGWIVYLQPGHFTAEFEHPIVAQLILNAVTWKPGTRTRKGGGAQGRQSAGALRSAEEQERRCTSVQSGAEGR